MAQQSYGAAKPVADWVKAYVVSPAKRAIGVIDKLPPSSKDGSSTDAGKLPDQWEKANQTSIERQKRGTEVKSSGKLYGARKRTRKRKDPRKREYGK